MGLQKVPSALISWCQMSESEVFYVLSQPFYFLVIHNEPLYGLPLVIWSHG